MKKVSIIAYLALGLAVIVAIGLWGSGYWPGRPKAPAIIERQAQDYVLPKIVYCGLEKAIDPGRLSRIYLVEESLCTVFGGEVFTTADEAKTEYGVKVDLKQVATKPVIAKTSQYSAYPGDSVKAGGQDLKVVSVDAKSARFAVGSQAETIMTGQSGQLENLDIKVKFACGETYRTDFSVSQYVCCPPQKNDILSCLVKPVRAAEADDDEGELTKKARQETEEDLKASGRSGYKGVILPKNVAKEYPSLDFVLFPFTAAPTELCCGCKQEYEGLGKWGGFTERQTQTALTLLFQFLNKKTSPDEEDKYTLVDRDETGMRFVLQEINWVKQNEEYFEPDKSVPKGEWINPDYVIEGSVAFRCCDKSKLVKASFNVKFINAKTEKQFEEVTYAPTECFDLVNSAGRLEAVAIDFAGKVKNAIIDRFVKKTK